MKKHHFLSLFLTLALVLALSLTGAFTLTARADYSGSCGANVTWGIGIYTPDLNSDSIYTLHINGTGDMYDYYEWNDAPFSSWYSKVSVISIGDGVTSIGDHAFHSFYRLTSVKIPDSVTRIGNNAFRFCNALTSITIPASITSIGYNAFCFCEALTSITVASDNPVYHSDGNCLIETKSKTLIRGCETSVIPSDGSVTSIADYAFSGCKMTSITIPDSVTSIGDSAFESCSSLTSVAIPDSVTSIGDSAFESCSSLTSVTISSNVTSIGEEAFSGCEALTDITVASGNPVYHSDGNCLIETKSKTLIRGCQTSVIPTDGSVTSIGDHAFFACNSLTSITLPEGITSIGDHAFFACNSLTSITLPEGITSIGDDAFGSCRALTSITVPKSVTSIGSDAFDWCYYLCDVYYGGTPEDWARVNIGDNNEYLTRATIHYTYPTSGTCGDNLTWELVNGILTISGAGNMTNYSSEDQPWYGRKDEITSVNINSGVTSIGSYAFYKCTSLTSITIPDSVTSIGSSAFYNCTGLISITIPNKVTRIGSFAFRDCSSLTSIILPSRLTSIDSFAFDGCTGLTDVYYTGTETKWNKITIRSYNTSLTNATIHYEYGKNPNISWTLENGTLTISGSGAMDNYFVGDAPWYSSAAEITSVVIGDGITTIGDSAFWYCTNLSNVTIPSSVTSIGDSAFGDCHALTSITIPDSVTSIGEEAFYSTYLTEIAIPNSVTTIGDSAFKSCPMLTSATIGSGVTTIGNSAFEECVRLTNITLPNSLTTIGNRAFYNCVALTDITIPEGVTTIGDYAFWYCKNLTSVTFPGSLTTIGNHAFYNCVALTGITIPDSVTTLGDYAFYECYGLTNVTVGNSVTGIGDYSFYCCRNLTSISLPDSVQRIGKYAFAYCSKLDYIALSTGLTSIEQNAFQNCYKLYFVYYTGGLTQWDAISIASGNSVLYTANIYYMSSPLFITAQPTSQRVKEGKTAKFTVEATGSGLTYQWQYRTSETGAWKNSTASTATTATLKTTAKTSRNGYQYRCVITDSNGTVVESDPATLYVLGVSSQPASVSVTDGTSVKFTVKATGDSLTYQWQYRTSSSGSWKNSGASTAKKATIKINGTTSKNGYQYRCKVTDSAGNVVYSDPATLTVLSATSITSQPSDAYITVGETAKFKVKATGDGLTYQWQYRTSESGKWKNSTASSAVTATVKVTGKTSRNGYQYRCKVTDSAGNVVYSDPATLTVLSAVSVTSQPSDAYITVGETAKFKVKATGDGLAYQWQYRTSESGKWKNSTASSAVTATVKVTGKTSRNGYQYRCKITDSAGNVVYSEPATLYVLGVKTQPNSVSVSAGTSVKFTVKATGDGLTYQWQYRTSSSGSWKNSGASTATKATIKINGTTSKNGYQYRCKITDSAGNVIYSDPATLTVN